MDSQSVPVILTPGIMVQGVFPFVMWVFAFFFSLGDFIFNP